MNPNKRPSCLYQSSSCATKNRKDKKHSQTHRLNQARREEYRGCAGLIRQGEEQGSRHENRKETGESKRGPQSATTRLRPESLA